jgi:subtilisin-like proprotein convertase family protein
MKKTYFSYFVTALAVAFVFTFSPGASAVSITFSNPSPITIPSVGTATPYPSTINVSSVIGLVADVNVTLTGLSHTFPQDVGVLLVGPGGQRVVLMDGAGGSTAITNVNITFDDQAASSLPSSGGIPSGSYRPTNFFPSDVFAPPAPGAPYGSLLSVFNGTNPNGVWSLFVQDFSAGDSGSVSGGWGLQITAAPEPSTLLLFGLGLVGIAAWIRRNQFF